MRLKFLGANRQVTGSRHGLDAAGKLILVDYGMFQERAFSDRNWSPCPVRPFDIDAVFLTHAHIDHCGMLPRLVAEGYRGPIFALPPTEELCEIMLRDAAEIQMEDAAYKKKRHQTEGRRGAHPEVPLYTTDDATATMKLFRPVGYGKPVDVGPGLTATFHDAGHILGSAMLEVVATEGEMTRRVVFSGDIGQWHKPLMHDPCTFAEADYVVMESTYGDRDHERMPDVRAALREIIRETVSRGGNVVIPTFALERAQEIMYHLSGLAHTKDIPPIPIYLDSPMASDITAVFRHNREYLDADARALIESDQPPLQFPGLKFARTVQESKAINEQRSPCIIMAASGMCTSGRIKHHLRQNLSRPDSTILFVGYQGSGTLGRQILDGLPDVRIHGKRYLVRATVTRLPGLSAHADRSGLLQWLSAFQQPPRRVYLVHGEEDVALNFADTIRNQLGYQVSVPEYCSDTDLD